MRYVGKIRLWLKMIANNSAKFLCYSIMVFVLQLASKTSRNIIAINLQTFIHFIFKVDLRLTSYARFDDNLDFRFINMFYYQTFHTAAYWPIKAYKHFIIDQWKFLCGKSNVIAIKVCRNRNNGEGEKLSLQLAMFNILHVYETTKMEETKFHQPLLATDYYKKNNDNNEVWQSSF